MGKKIVIDPGHGGSDPGTSANGIVEKDFNLMISKYMNDRFKELGIDSSLTRDSDITLSPSVRPKKVQSFYGNGNDVIVISNHVNSGGGDGAEIIYALRNTDTLSKRIAKEFENKGQNVRKYYQRRLPSNSSKDYYYIHRDTPNNETILVEYGFVDSTLDDVDLLKNSWQDLAEAVIKAVCDYINVSYTPINDAGYYKVKSGDSLWSIAKKYNTSVDELKKLNNLSSNLLSVGQILYLPESKKEQDNNDTYIVKSGDTLYAIANKFNTTISDLKSINNLSTTNLKVGQILKIPSKINTSKYIVQSGDSLYKIANKYNTTVSELQKLNNLNSTVLQIGQELLIPNNYDVYTVKSGDTLYSIARKYGTTVSMLQDINNLSTSVLSVGQKLLVP